MTWPTQPDPYTAVLRVPMTPREHAAVRAAAQRHGISMAQVVRRALFGVAHEIRRVVSPNETIDPEVVAPIAQIGTIETSGLE